MDDQCHWHEAMVVLAVPIASSELPNAASYREQGQHLARKFAASCWLSQFPATILYAPPFFVCLLYAEAPRLTAAQAFSVALCRCKRPSLPVLLKCRCIFEIYRQHQCPPHHHLPTRLCWVPTLQCSKQSKCKTVLPMTARCHHQSGQHGCSLLSAPGAIFLCKAASCC